jgi:zinc and cadmium transporter
MSSELISILVATLIISSGSLIGVLTIGLRPALLNRLILPLVSLSAGTMLGAAFLHLLPESLEVLGDHAPFEIALYSFIAFFALERFLHWRHCHDKEHITKHTLGIMNLIGDGVHNFLDGLLIAAAFASGETLGIVAALSIALHEIPQEIGDYGVLLHSGFSRAKAIIANVGVSLMAVLGGLFGYYLSHSTEFVSANLLPVTAGAFIYIGASDLIPELKSTNTTRKILLTFTTFMLGIILMMATGESH